MSNAKNFYPYFSLVLQIARLPRKMQEIDADDAPKWGQMAVYDCTIGQKKVVAVRRGRGGDRYSQRRS